MIFDIKLYPCDIYIYKFKNNSKKTKIKSLKDFISQNQASIAASAEKKHKYQKL